MPATDLPSPGLGTMYNTDPKACAATIVRATEVGYRHIDTAQKYGNEAFVGDGIARSDLARDELFVATKIHEEILSYDDVLRTAAESLDRLGLEYVDLLYVHWPAESTFEDRYDPAETLPAFDELVESGATRHVGVSNFSVDLLEEARDHLDAPIFAHQIEMTRCSSRPNSSSTPGRTSTTSSRTARSCRGPSVRYPNCGRSPRNTASRPNR